MVRAIVHSALDGKKALTVLQNYLILHGPAGSAPDDAQAMQWYKKAAAQGNQPANSRLAVLKVKHSRP
jgi:TPR repeat protein